MVKQVGNRMPDDTRRRAVTIYDVAESVGLSASTVSRALNKPGRINATTELRVRAAAEALGYLANPMARALQTGRTWTIALILSDITNPVYFDLVRGAENVAAENGFSLVLADSQESADIEARSIDRLLPSVDGLILVGSRLPDADVMRIAASKPVVTANRNVAGIASVIPDVVPGLTQTLDHLFQFGHSRIGYVSGPTASWMNHHRWQTLFDAAVASGMSIVEIPTTAPTLDGGRASCERVLASGVTAVITYNDLVAMGLLMECRKHGIAVPDRLSVVGFDDIFGADLMTPALTTIRSPLGLVGSVAVGQLVAGIEGSDPAEGASLPTTLIVRASTGPLLAPVAALPHRAGLSTS